MSLQKPKLCQYVVLANKLYFSHNRPALNREAFRQDLLTAHFNLNTFCELDKSLFRRALGEKGSNLTVTGSVFMRRFRLFIVAGQSMKGATVRLRKHLERVVKP